MFYWFLRSVTLCGNPPTTIVVRPPFDKGGKGTGHGANTPSNNNLSNNRYISPFHRPESEILDG